MGHAKNQGHGLVDSGAKRVFVPLGGNIHCCLFGTGLKKAKTEGKKCHSKNYEE